jgi:hypothetical protein
MKRFFRVRRFSPIPNVGRGVSLPKAGLPQRREPVAQKIDAVGDDLPEIAVAVAWQAPRASTPTRFPSRRRAISTVT